MRITTNYAALLVITLFCTCGNRYAKLPPEEPAFTDPQLHEVRLLQRDGRIKPGDTLSKIMNREKICQATALKIISAFAQVCNNRLIKAGQKYCIFSDSASTVHRFEYYPEICRTITVRLDSCGDFCGQVEQLPVINKIRAIKGQVQSTLYDAILDLGETPELISEFSDVFQWDLDFFTDPRKGDEFRIVFESNYVMDPTKPDSLGEFLSYGRVLSGQYFLSGEPITAIYFDNAPKGSGYYDLSGKSFQKTFLKSPLNYRRISSYFSGGRLHPILKIVRSHYAVDFAAPTGTPVSAAADGVIIEKGYNSGIGNFVKIRHKNPHFVTVYGHLSKFAADIQAGSQVKQKDVIGYVGSTGLATGPHLHYAFNENGRPINPLRIKNTSGDPVLSENEIAFEQVKSEMLLKLGHLDEPAIASFFGTNASMRHRRAALLSP